MSNSPLVSYKKISPNSNNPRNHKIDKITIHHMAGNLTVEACGNVFASASRQASSNYGIGTDGRIGMYVEEKNRSWCSSNAANDNRAVTIEVANDGGAPDWHVSDKAMTSLIDLCVDICKRNDIERLNFTGDATGNLTQHNYFKATSCPGPYLKSKFQYIADEVNKRLGEDESASNKPTIMPNVPFMVNVKVSDLNYRSKPSMDGVVKGQTGKGVFTITEVSDGWGKLKSGAGWIYLENPDYLIVMTSEQDHSGPFTVKIDIPNLNIRKGPGTNYATNGYTGKGVFTITEVSNGWGKLKSGAGWICLQYAEKL